MRQIKPATTSLWSKAKRRGRLFEVLLDTSAFDGIEPSRTPALLPDGKEFSITSPELLNKKGGDKK